MKDFIGFRPKQADRNESLLHHQFSYKVELVLHIGKCISIFQDKDQMSGTRRCKANREGRIEMGTGQLKAPKDFIHEFAWSVLRGCLRRIQC